MEQADGQIKAGIKYQIWTDRSTFEKNCLQDFDAENHYGSSQVVEYSRVTFDQKCKGQLSEAKTRILIGLVLYFNNVFKYSYLFSTFCP